MIPVILAIHERFIRCDICCCKYDDLKAEQKSKKPGCIDRALLSEFFLKILKVVRWPFAIVPIGWGIAAIVLGSKLIPQQHLEHFFPHHHFVTYRIYAFFELFQYNYVGVINIDFYWGALGIDRGNFTRWDTMKLGEIVWDETFDPALEENQQRIYDFCIYTSEQDWVFYKTYICPMESFKNYLEKKKLPFPIAKDKFNAQFEEFFTKDKLGKELYSTGFIGWIDSKL